MGGKSAPAPDYSAMSAATNRATDSAERIAKRQQDFAERQYAEMKPLADKVSASQLAAQEQQMTQAKDYYDYNVNTFRPVERGLVADAMNFNTDSYKEQLASQAAADVSRAFGNAQAVSGRELSRRGIGPGSGNAMAMGNQNALALASAGAGAQTGARMQADQLGWARRMDVTGLGRGLSGASTAAYQGATGAGSSGLNSGMAAGNQFADAYGRGASTALAGGQMGIQGAGQILNSQTSVHNAETSKADPIASIVGMGVGAYMGRPSDIRLKMNIGRVGTDERTGLPVYEFEYKATPGERFRGVMAHEVEVSYPDAVTTMPNGYKAVFYERLGMEMVRV